MSNEVNEVTPQATMVTPAVENNQPIEVKNPDAVLAKNKELLGKLNTSKAELEELREFKKSIALSEEEKKGNYEGVIKSLREENESLKGEVKNVRKTTAYTKFEDQIKSAATKEGCVNPDKMMRLITKEQISSVEIDDKFNVNGDDMKRLMDSLKEEHSDIGLFKSQNVNINTIGGHIKAEVKTAKDMSKDELIAALKSL